MTKPWFKVDRDGLRELVQGKPAWHAIAELLQNAWDEASTYVTVTLEKLPGRPAAKLIVEDDNPEGFRNIEHAYTLFARSDKRADPTKRGRFNLGEKLVLARCIDAEIITTKGTVVFRPDGTRTTRRLKRNAGTVFTGLLRMNQQEYDEAVKAVWSLMPPIPTTFNDAEIPMRQAEVGFTAQLPTVVADDDGVLRKTARNTTVEIYEVKHGETASIYEMGIPVVETGDRYHVDVGQKVPLTMDRDNVPPSYLRKLRALVLNHTADLLSEDDVTEAWVDAALEDPNVEDSAVRDIIEARYGDKTVIADPTDLEANATAVAKGYTVIHGRSLSKRQWENVKRADFVEPAGRVFPTARQEYSFDGELREVLSEAEYTTDQRAVVVLAETVAEYALDLNIRVRIVLNESRFRACYGRRELTFFHSTLGKRWWRSENVEEHLRLIIHELAHEHEANHLSDNFHRACCRIGAKVALAVQRGELEIE